MDDPVCLECSHKHPPGEVCADHQWLDCCPYVGLECPSELDRTRFERDQLDRFSRELMGGHHQFAAQELQALSDELLALRDSLAGRNRERAADGLERAAHAAKQRAAGLEEERPG